MSSRHRGSLFFKGLVTAVLLSFSPSAVAAWNFLPAQAVHAAQGAGEMGLKVASRPAGAGLTVLSDEELEGLRSRAEDGKEAVLPGLMLARAVRAGAAGRPRGEASRVQVAQLGGTEMEPLAPAGAAGEALIALDAAKESVGAEAARERFEQAYRRAGSEELAALEEALIEGAASLQSVEAQTALLRYYGWRADAAVAAGAETQAQTFHNAAQELGWELAFEHPEHALSFYAVLGYYEAAMQVRADSAGASLEQMVTELPSGMAQWAARFLLAEHLSSGAEADLDAARAHFELVLAQKDADFLKAALADASVPSEYKGYMEYALARSLQALGRTEEAQARFAEILEKYPYLPQTSDVLAQLHDKTHHGQMDTQAAQANVETKTGQTVTAAAAAAGGSTREPGTAPAEKPVGAQWSLYGDSRAERTALKASAAQLIAEGDVLREAGDRVGALEKYFEAQAASEDKVAGNRELILHLRELVLATPYEKLADIEVYLNSLSGVDPVAHTKALLEIKREYAYRYLFKGAAPGSPETEEYREGLRGERGVQPYLELSLFYLEAFPEEPAAAEVLFRYSECARGARKGDNGFFRHWMGELESSVERMGPSVGRWAARYFLAQHYAPQGPEPKPDKSFHHLYVMYVERMLAAIQEALVNESVSVEEQRHLGFLYGASLYGVRQYDLAVKAWESVITRHQDPRNLEWEPEKGITRGGGSNQVMLSAYMRARALFERPSQSKHDAIEAFKQFQDWYPSSTALPESMLYLGGAHCWEGEFVEAAKVYRDIIELYPETPYAYAAQADLEFALASMPGGESGNTGGATQSAVTTAQICGPKALQGLLARAGKHASLDELTDLAATDATGTSMLGLAHAASAKGVALAGVHAAEAEHLPLPFIAYVNGNHYVLVTDVAQDAVEVSDNGGLPEFWARSRFDEAWSGEALASAADLGVAQAMNAEAMDAARGGCVPKIDDGDHEFPCEQHDTCNPETCPAPPGTISSPAGSIGYSSPTFSGSIDTFNTGLQLGQTDISVPVRGGIDLSFSRYYRADKDGQQADNSNLGVGWSHSFTSDASMSFVVQKSKGDRLALCHCTDNVWDDDRCRKEQGEFICICCREGFHNLYECPYEIYGSTCYNHEHEVYHYTVDVTVKYATGKARTWKYEWSTGNLTKSGQVIKHFVDMGRLKTEYRMGSKIYDFEGPKDEDGNLVEWDQWPDMDDLLGDSGTASPEEALKLEAIRNLAGSSSISVSYDTNGEVTTIDAPGDNRSLHMTYSGDYITKVELKEGSTVKQTVKYAYDGDNLTKVCYGTDWNNDPTVEYAYGLAWTDIFYTWAGNERITKVTDAGGNEVDFYWETYPIAYPTTWASNYLEVTLPNGLESRYSRNTTTNVATIKNYDGVTEMSRTMNYPVADDELDHSSRKRYYNFDTSSYTDMYYDWDGDNMTKVRGHSGDQLAAYTYDAYDRVVTATQGSTTTNVETTYAYADEEDRRPTSVTSGGQTTTYTYVANTSQRAISTITPQYSDGNAYDFDYDAYGQLATITNPLGYTQQFEYDTRGNMTAMNVETAASTYSETEYDYDVFGRVVTLTDPLDHITVFEYDAGGCGGCGSGNGQLTKIKVDPAGLNRITEFDYDANGNLLTTTSDPSGVNLTTEYEYDGMNMVTKVREPAGSTANTMTYTYDKMKRLLTMTDFEGTNTTYAYDGRGRMATTTDPVDSIIYTYTELGQLSTVTDGNSHTWSYAYDGAQRLISMATPLGKKTVYAYDAYGRIITVGAGASGTTEPTIYAYNSTTGLLSTVKYARSDSSTKDTVTYYYDNAGQMTRLTDWNDSTPGIQYAYDRAGRIKEITKYSTSRVLAYTYDAAGNVVTMNDYYNNEQTYVYNTAGQLSTITAPGSKVWDFDYDSLGRPTKYSHPITGRTTNYAYDSRGRMTQIQHKSGSSELDGFAYTLDKNGNITRQEYSILGSAQHYWDYEYDGRMRLITAERLDGSESLVKRYSYTYDDGDNLLTRAVYDGGGTVNDTYTYNSDNEQTSMSIADGAYPYALTYDAWGRMTEFDNTGAADDGTLVYRYGGKLYQRTYNGPVTQTYGTSGDGKRHSLEEGGSTKYYYWDAGYTVVNEQNGDIYRSYIARTLAHMDLDAGENPPVTTWSFYFHDHLGSTRRIRNAAGTSIASYEFEPYGGTYATTGDASATTHQWAGLEKDTGPYHYAPFRTYNNIAMRWTTRDPLGMVDGTNVYTYVRGNPVRLFDRLGLRASIPRPPRPSSKDCALKYAECVDDADFLKAQRDRDLEARHKACFYGISVNCSYTCSVYCTAATGWWTLGTSLLVCIPTCITGCTVGAQMACDAFLLKEQKRIDTMWEEDRKRCREDLDKCLTDYEDKCDAYEDYRDILN